MFPEIHLGESLALPTYLVYLSLLYCFLIFYVFKRAEKLKKSAKTALDLALIMMVAGFIGGRLLHVLFEAPMYYQENWMRLVYFWEGGFVFFGGFLGAFAFCLLYVFITHKKTFKKTSLQWMDFYAPVIALGYGLGRISCFLAGCCYGTFCDLPWAVNTRHPVQLYMTAWELIVFALLIFIERNKKWTIGKLFFFWLICHGLGRLVAEQFRDDFRGSYLLSLSLSSWISLGLILAGAISFFIISKQTKDRR